MTKTLRNPIPKYARVPLILVVVANFIVYYISKLLIRNAQFYDFSFGIDDVIPFCSAFIIFYVLAYAQWVIGYIVMSRESREYCNRIVMGDIVAKLICFVIFVALPTTMIRPEITGTDVFSRLTSFVYDMDSPVNLFPSVHCLESWVCMRTALTLKKVPLWYRVIMCTVSLGVFASVVLVKQHVFIDIPAGIIVFEIGFLLNKLLKIDRLFNIKSSRT